MGGSNKPEGYVVKSRFFNQSDLEGIYSDKNYIHYMLGELSHEQFVGGYLTSLPSLMNVIITIVF